MWNNEFLLFIFFLHMSNGKIQMYENKHHVCTHHQVCEHTTCEECVQQNVKITCDFSVRESSIIVDMTWNSNERCVKWNRQSSRIQVCKWWKIILQGSKDKTLEWKYETSDWIVRPNSHAQRLNRRTWDN